MLKRFSHTIPTIVMQIAVPNFLGFRFLTTMEYFDVQKCKWYRSDNNWELLMELIRWGGIQSADNNSAVCWFQISAPEILTQGCSTT